MSLRIVGSGVFAKNSEGRLLSRIATIFPHDNVIVTVPGIHFFQQDTYLKLLDEERQAAGLAPMTSDERHEQRKKAVSLFVDDGAIQIRADSDDISLIFAADAVLQKILPKLRIRFLIAMNPKVREAVKRRGECWRITPLPKETAEMQQMIRESRVAIENREIYYYSKATGTRWLTCQEFGQLADMDDDALHSHLVEIRKYCVCRNDQGNREVDFFLADRAFRGKLSAFDFTALDAAAARAAHNELRQAFAEATPSELRLDDVENAEWRRRMYAVLVPHGEEVSSEEELLGLGAEFYMQIEWLPGGRIDGGELILDPVLDEARCATGEADSAALNFGPAKSLLFNLVREYGDLEYLNLGRIGTSIARRPFPGGRRGVFVVEMKRRDSSEEILKIIRMQRWGVHEHLDDGKPLLDALVNSEEYTEYILDRRLACRQLGMNLPVQVVTRKISETYFGKQKRYWTTRIWSPYFERDYIRGITTDTVPMCRFEDHEFAVRFAAVLGRAAAPNIIVGRQSRSGTVIFDNGDEVLIEDEHGLPIDIMVSDHTGAFVAFESDIYRLDAYAAPINKRIAHVAKPVEFAGAYVDACLTNFVRIQQEYRDWRRAFDTLFADRPRVEAGSLAYRWERVLKRLDETDPKRLEAALRRAIQCK
jgi:hypothetical protein